MNWKIIKIAGVLILPGIIILAVLVNRGLLNKAKLFMETSEPANQASVPLPSQEDIIRTFFNLIDEGRIPEAVSMLAPKSVANESSKQTWGVQFNAFEKVKVKSIEPAGENFYKVVLDVKMKPESENAVIPFYGYNDGENTRWVELEKAGNLWKIIGLATGP